MENLENYFEKELPKIQSGFKIEQNEREDGDSNILIKLSDEAAKVDGANSATIFFKITLPYMLFVTTPYLITTFTGNINNFNVIFLLTKGEPVPVGYTAGKTDLLVTWLYKLTVDQQYFNVGAVVGILTFVILAIVSLVTYRNSGSYKNEEGFQ